MELLHPSVVHLPIALSVLMPLIAVGVVVSWRRGWFQRRVWALVVALQTMLVASGFAALQTGEIDEERVERVVDEAAIEAHEEAAELFVWTSAAVLFLMIGALAVRKEHAALAVAVAATAGTLGVLGVGYWTGKKGGELVYEHGAANAFIEADTAPAGPKVACDDDDDD